MRKNLVFLVICMILLITKYVISGGYYDFTLQQNELQSEQGTLIDDNKRAIAKLENYRSPSYLFSQKASLGLHEINPEKTIILSEVSSTHLTAVQPSIQPTPEPINPQPNSEVDYGYAIPNLE